MEAFLFKTDKNLCFSKSKGFILPPSKNSIKFESKGDNYGRAKRSKPDKY